MVKSRRLASCTPVYGFTQWEYTSAEMLRRQDAEQTLKRIVGENGCDLLPSHIVPRGDLVPGYILAQKEARWSRRFGALVLEAALVWFTGGGGLCILLAVWNNTEVAPLTVYVASATSIVIIQ